MEEKDKGGLGIRDFEDINRAQIAKLIWKFLEQPDCLWVQIMKAKYCRNFNIWEVKYNGSSSAWKAFLDCRKDLENKCQWMVGNGENIHIFKDPWVPNLNNPIPEKLNSAINITKVNELWLHNPVRWNESLLSQLFSLATADAIQSIYIPVEETKDKLIWRPHPNGEFSTKSFMKTLKCSRPSSSGTNIEDFPWKPFWKVKNLVPKVQLFIWRVIHDGIAVYKVMGKFITGLDHDCRLCRASDETIEHLFLNCPVARAAFFGSNLGLRVNGSFTVTDLLSRWLQEKGDYKMFRLASCIMWATRRFSVTSPLTSIESFRRLTIGSIST